VERRPRCDSPLFLDLCSGLRRRKHNRCSPATHRHAARHFNDHHHHERDVFLGEAAATATPSAHSDREVTLITRISHRLPYHAARRPLHFSESLVNLYTLTWLGSAPKITAP